MEIWITSTVYIERNNQEPDQCILENDRMGRAL
jgi:hypothetical protein